MSVFVQSFEDTSADPDLPVVRELGLGRVRVLSPEVLSLLVAPHADCYEKENRPFWW